MSEEEQKFTIPELMAVTLASYIKNGDVMFQGAATPLPMVAIELARATHAPDITYFSAFGVSPSEPINFEKLLTEGMKKYGEQIKLTNYLHAREMWDQWQKGRLSLEFLRPAQIDKYFNCNNTVIYGEERNYHKPKLRLPGGMAVSDAINLMGRVVLYTTRHIKRNLVEKVDFLMVKGYPRSKWRRDLGLGEGCVAFVTNLCVFEPDPETSAMMIKSIHPGYTLDDVLENTGFEPVIPDKIPETRPPTDEELEMIRTKIDPIGYREMDFPSLRNKVMMRVAEKGIKY
ncbi:MAG: CoA-transferase subunit beta [Candidatus Helarchaeales archaeon]